METYRDFLFDKICANIVNVPEKAAYRINSQDTTFAEMDRMASSIATAIVAALPADAMERERPVRVGIHLPRSAHFISCIWACVKLGCSYVPIDMAIPQKRFDFVVEDSEIDFLIDAENLQSMIETVARPDIPCFHKEMSEAYLIYTSGTTGAPKGVSQTYRTIYNYMQRAVQPDDFHVTSDSRVLQFASINFDVSVMEIFVSLYAGCTAVVAQTAEKQDVQKLYQLLKREKVTFCYLPPSLLAMFPDYNLPSLATLSAGGEAIPHSLVKKIVGNYPFRFVNGFHP